LNLLKKALVSAPCLVVPDLSGTPVFVVRTDASVRAVGAVIETASGHPCAFYSHPLNSAEQNYPARELEILAVVLVLEEYDHWLAHAIIKVMTDHQSLVHLTTCKVNRRLARFLETLLRYNITFCYVRGPTNVVADALSRREDYLGGEGEMTLVEQNSKSFHSYFQQQVAKAEAVFLWCLGNTIDSPCPPSYLFCFNQSCGTSTGHLLIGLGLGPH